jgi:hypothetical protein
LDLGSLDIRIGVVDEQSVQEGEYEQRVAKKGERG